MSFHATGFRDNDAQNGLGRVRRRVSQQPTLAATSVARKPSQSHDSRRRERVRTRQSSGVQATKSGGVSAAMLSAAIQQKFLGALGNRTRPTMSRSESGPGSASIHQQHDSSLTSQLGIERKQPKVLSNDEWEGILFLSRQRKSSDFPCPICQEDFKLEPQVLLSCSHVFHKNCVASFERFAQRRCCPICRAEAYGKKIISDGAKSYQRKSAVRIQSVFRGYRDRKKYLKQRREVPPRDATLRQHFYMNRLTDTTDRIVAAVDQKQSSLDALFAEFDNTLACSNAALHAADLTFSGMDRDEWTVIRQDADDRQMEDCPICMASFNLKDRVEMSSRTSGAYDPLTHKPIMLLSCSHVFHESCLASFENFYYANADSRGPDSVGPPLGCPLCRCAYTKMPYSPSVYLQNP